MDISNINGTNKVQPTQRTPRTRKAEQAQPRGNDVVEISSAGQQAIEVAKVKELVRSQPEVRIERVREAAERIASGNYMTDKIADLIAEKIADSLTK